MTLVLPDPGPAEFDVMRFLGLHEWMHGRVCRCRSATLRTYDELIARDEPLNVALEAATVVYRYHHPDVPVDIAMDTVIGWLLARRGRDGRMSVH